MNEDINKVIEELYEDKSFIVPNGGDIRKVEITYEDWLWIEDFIKHALITIHTKGQESGAKKTIELASAFLTTKELETINDSLDTYKDNLK